MVDDSGVYSALPGTPPPWNDYDDEQPATRTDAATVTLAEFPRERLKFVEKLGEGLFGEVDVVVFIISLDKYLSMYLRRSKNRRTDNCCSDLQCNGTIKWPS